MSDESSLAKLLILLLAPALLRNLACHYMRCMRTLPVGRQSVLPTPPGVFEGPKEIQDPAPAPKMFPISMIWTKCASGWTIPAGALRASDFLLEF